MHQHIEYAKTQAYATRKIEDPNFVPPRLLKISAEAAALAVSGSAAKVTVSHAQEENERKRARDDQEMADGERSKKQKEDGDDMDMDVDEQTGTYILLRQHRVLLAYWDCHYSIKEHIHTPILSTQMREPPCRGDR